MQWTVTCQGKTTHLRLPGTMVSGENATALIDPGRAVIFRWEASLKSLVITDPNSGLEKIIGMRAFECQRPAGEPSYQLRLEISGTRGSSLTVEVSPLALGEGGRQSRHTQAGSVVRSPMTGKVLQVLTSEGSMVESGEVLVIIEAMKMENKIVAPRAGKLVSLKVRAGGSVQVGAELALIDH